MGGNILKLVPMCSQEVLARLRLLQQPLQQALGATLEWPACEADRTCAEGPAVPAAEVSGTHLLLDQIPCLPLLPTLNGWLLGYPAVYLVSLGEDAPQEAPCRRV